MDLAAAPLWFYGEATEVEPLEWQWVEEQLRAAGTYWIVATAEVGFPHPRPVWGVWSPVDDGGLWLSIGSPRIAAQIASGPLVTAHLESGVDVVIVEGLAAVVEDQGQLAGFTGAYDSKYDWAYSVAEYGPPTRIEPTTVIGWRSGGWAGRDGFRRASKWRRP